MTRTVKEFFIEKGLRREVAVEMDEITLAMHSRITRFNKQGVEKNLVMIDFGKYRHLEQKSAHSLPELQRMMLDYGLLILNFNERFRLLEHYDILKLNFQTGEYEFTAFGNSFFAPRGA
jgi:hypothetical protein